MLSNGNNMLLGAMRDRASVNSAAMHTVSIMYPSVLNIGCTSHALDSVGEKFSTPNLHLFFTLWISLLAHSQSAKAFWKERTKRTMASYSNTHWWSRWAVMHQTLQQFEDVEPFLTDAEVSLATCQKLLQIFNNPQQIALVKIELAAVIDIGSHFVKATYNLEGDGILDLDVMRNCSRFVLLSHHSIIPMFKQLLGHCSLVTLHISKQC